MTLSALNTFKIFPPIGDYFVKSARLKLLVPVISGRKYYETPLICGDKIYHLFMVKVVVKYGKFKAGYTVKKLVLSSREISST
jgi:hypothetical protein